MPRWTVQYKIQKLFEDHNFTEYKELDSPFNPSICTIEVNRNFSDDFDRILRANGYSFLNETIVSGEINAPYFKYEIWEK